MQGELREKIVAKFGSTLQDSLKSQVSQVKATELHNSAKARDGWFRENSRELWRSNHASLLYVLLSFSVIVTLLGRSL